MTGGCAARCPPRQIIAGELSVPGVHALEQRKAEMLINGDIVGVMRLQHHGQPFRFTLRNDRIHERTESTAAFQSGFDANDLHDVNALRREIPVVPELIRYGSHGRNRRLQLYEIRLRKCVDQFAGRILQNADQALHRQTVRTVTKQKRGAA